MECWMPSAVGLGGYNGSFNLPEDIIGKIEPVFILRCTVGEWKHRLEPPVQSKEMRTVRHWDRMPRRIFAFLSLEIFRIQLEKSWAS